MIVPGRFKSREVSRKLDTPSLTTIANTIVIIVFFTVISITVMATMLVRACFRDWCVCGRALRTSRNLPCPSILNHQHLATGPKS